MGLAWRQSIRERPFCIPYRTGSGGERLPYLLLKSLSNKVARLLLVGGEVFWSDPALHASTRESFHHIRRIRAPVESQSESQMDCFHLKGIPLLSDRLSTQRYSLTRVKILQGVTTSGRRCELTVLSNHPSPKLRSLTEPAEGIQMAFSSRLPSSM